MTDEDLKNSITLIGPSCVGKSLLASEISKKLNMPYVCIDDLIVMIGYEQSGLLNRNKKTQKRFMNLLVQDVSTDPELSRYLRNPKYREKETQLIKEFVDLYNYYADMFGGLHHFYDLLNAYEQRQNRFNTTIMNVENLKVVSAQIIATILEIAKSPLIFDVPAPFGWQTDDPNLKMSLNVAFGIKSKDINLSDIQMFINSFLNDTKTVLLTPGLDYNERNSTRHSKENNLLLANLDNYYDHAKISITTNGVFNNPSSRHLQRRSWLNPEEAIEKEKLKNKGEVNNVCDQIIGCIEELNEVKSI